MPAEARITPIWNKQKFLVAVFLIGIGGWFFSDAAIGYPHSNERWTAHEELVKSGHESDWPAVAKSRGWTEKLPHKYYGKGDVIMQWVCGGFATVLGLLSLAYWLTQKGGVVRTDGEAVYSPAGTRIPFDAITGLGKKHWEQKGLATVLYQMDGRKGRFILDDYKFDREATHQILAEIEEKLVARINS
jgi:hypothetical protein